MDEETQQAAEEVVPEEASPDRATGDDTPRGAPPSVQEEVPAPEAFVLVEYRPPPGTHTPVYQAGRYWHGGSHYALPEPVARELETQHQGFAAVGPATAPAPRTP